MIRTLIIAVLATALFVPLAQAEKKKYDALHCRSGTSTTVSGSKEATVRASEHKGINPETGQASFCIGVNSSVGKKRMGHGYCKTMDKDGDFTLLSWTSSPKRGEGTWEFIHGTGKWKGVTGGGKYKVEKFSRGIAKGTFQLCVRETGTYELPKK